MLPLPLAERLCASHLAKPLTIPSTEYGQDSPAPHQIAWTDCELPSEVIQRYFRKSRLPDERLDLGRRAELSRPPYPIGDRTFKPAEDRFGGFRELQQSFCQGFFGRSVRRCPFADLVPGLCRVVIEQDAVREDEAARWREPASDPPQQRSLIGMRDESENAVGDDQIGRTRLGSLDEIARPGIELESVPCGKFGADEKWCFATIEHSEPTSLEDINTKHGRGMSTGRQHSRICGPGDDDFDRLAR